MEVAKRPQHWNEIELIQEISRIINAYNAVIHSDDDKQLVFAAAYPDHVFDLTGQSSISDTRLVCYDIIKKDNGSIGANTFDRNTKVRPYQMEVQTVKINEGQSDEKLMSQQVFMKPYDVMYRFDCLAPSDTESMELVREFERILEIHGTYLETGCKRFIYNGRRPSYFSRDTRYKSRTCEFFAQVEEHWYTLADRIEEIHLKYLGLDRPILPPE